MTRSDRLLAACLAALALGCGSETGEPGGGGAAAPTPAASDTGDASAGDVTPREAPTEPFPDEAAARGLVYRNRSGRAEKPTVLEANGAGVALLDLGGDGDLDVVFSQGLSDLETLLKGPGADLSAFTNDGEGHFRPANAPGLSGWWTGLATGDVDGDGRTDLVAAGYGDLALLVQGDGGTLEPRDAGFDALFATEGTRLVPGEPREAGLPAPHWATSVALFDADRDGVLDLYVGRYLELDPVAPPIGALGDGALAVPCVWKGHEVFCGPRGMTPQPDALLRGTGAGGFVDVTSSWLQGARPAFTLGVAPFDADFDGDTDLYVANDSAPNQLFVNELGEASAALLERAMGAGVAVSPDGLAEAGMGIAVGDVNRDGSFDMAVTNFSDEPTQLYFGAELGFTCETYRMGLGHATRRMLSWGAHLNDFDGDGWIELFTANGHVYPQADEPGTGTSYGQADALFHLGPGKLARVEAATPDSILATKRGTRGTAVGDVDGDGAIDLVLAHIDAPAGLGMNRSGLDANRLLVRCIGPETPDETSPYRTPPDGKGARVIVVPNLPPNTSKLQEHALLREVQTARGFQSASSEWLHFGLGAAREYSEIAILWPSGRRERLPAGTAGRRITVQEGQGVIAEEPLR